MKIIITFIIAAFVLPALAAEETGVSNNSKSIHFGGPSSVPGQVSSDREKSKLPVIKDLLDLQAYYDFKESLTHDHGFTFGLDYNMLYQYATPSNTESDAAGGVFRLYGSWAPTGISSSHPGALIIKLENRHRLGTDIAPQQLAGEVGYAGLTAVTFSDAGGLLTNLYWTQNFNANNFAYIVGQVDTTDYVDVYGLVNIWTEFNNLAFTTNPAIPVPDQGLGGALRWAIKDRYYIVAGLADANGDPGKPLDGFDSFFNDREYFKHIELGWEGSWEQRFNDNVHLTLWHVDERTESNVPDGWGTAFSFSREFGKWLPFLRLGYGDGGGALLDRSISTGFGYSPGQGSDRFALGVSWGQPNQEIYNTDVNDQYTIETYYRVQVLKHLQVTPDVQLLLNPALNPDEDHIWIFSLRARLVF
jgi:porin